MDANEKNLKREKCKDSAGAIKRLGAMVKDKLNEKGEREVRERLRAVIRFALTVAATSLLSIVEIPFGAFPFALSLACSSRRHLLPVAIGILIASLSGLDPIYGLTCIALMLARVLFAILPQICLRSCYVCQSYLRC